MKIFEQSFVFSNTIYFMLYQFVFEVALLFGERYFYENNPMGCLLIVFRYAVYWAYRFLTILRVMVFFSYSNWFWYETLQYQDFSDAFCHNVLLIVGFFNFSLNWAVFAFILISPINSVHYDDLVTAMKKSTINQIWLSKMFMF